MVTVTDHAELLFEADRIHSINDFDIGVDRDNTPGINLRPSQSTISVGGGAAQSGGGVVIEDGSDNPRAFIGENNGAGSFLVTNPDVDGGVSIDGRATDPAIQVFAGPGGITATIEHTQTGGRVTASGTKLPTEPVVVAEARSGTRFNGPGGYLTVRNSDGESTGEIDGRDGTLLLRGGAELGPNGREEAIFGGGELLLGVKRTPDDLHVHVRGETDSDYGVDAGNRPRVWFDGPNATLEVGREPLGADRPGTSGSISVNDEFGIEVLGLDATGGGASEITFRLNDGGSAVNRAKVEATADGLLVSVHNPNQAGTWYHTLLVTKQGELVTKHPIQENVTL